MVEQIPGIGRIGGLEEIKRPDGQKSGSGPSFTDALKEAVTTVDGLQKESTAAQRAFAAGEDVDLHDVLIKIEEADIAFRTMMQVRNKLVDAYREVMRLGSGG